MSNQNRKATTLFLIAMFVGGLSVTTTAVGQDDTFDAGTKVEVRRFDKWFPGVIVKKRISDIYEVQFFDERADRKRTSFFRADDIRRTKTNAASSSTVRNKTDSQKAVDENSNEDQNENDAEVSETRIWVSSNGKFKIEANLISDNGEMVVLEKTDGSRINVPRNKLSENDVLFLDSLGGMTDAHSGENPFDTYTPENEANNKKNKASGKHKGRSAISNPDESLAKPFDFSTEQQFALSVTANEQQPPKRSFAFDDAINNGCRVETALVNPGGSHLIFSVGNMWDNSVRGQIGVVDLKGGQATSLFELPFPQTEAQDVCSEGKVVLTRTNSNQSGMRLDAFRIENGLLEHIVSWNAGKNKAWSGAYKYARLLDANRVVTLDSDLLEIIQLEPFQTLFKSEVDDDTEFVVSPDNASLIVYKQGKLYVVDPDTGVASGVVAIGMAPRTISISPTGKIALARSGNLKILNSNGVTQQEFTTPFVAYGTSAYWLSDRLIGFNGKLGSVNVLDAEVGVWLIQYQTASKDHTDHSGYLWRTAIKSGKATVDGIDIAQPDQLSKLDNLPAKAIAFVPGDTISLDIRLPFSRKINEEIRAGFVAQLKELGLKVQPNARLTLSAFIKKLPTFQEGSRTAGGLSKVVATVKPSETVVQLTKNNKVVWKRIDENRLDVLYARVASQRAFQQQVDERTSPDPAFVKGIKLPKKVVVHRGEKPMALVWIATGPNPKVNVKTNW